jgi:hypothetical protein
MISHFERWSKLLTPVFALFAAVWVVWQYVDTANRESTTPFYEERLKDCRAASSAAAMIAEPVEPTKQQEQQDIFWGLYYGPLVMVENQVVSDKMDSFGRVLISYAPQLRDGSVKADILEELQAKALDISSACRDLTSQDFRLHLAGIDKLQRLIKGKSKSSGTESTP